MKKTLRKLDKSATSKIKTISIAIALLAILFVSKAYSFFQSFTRSEKGTLTLGKYSPINDDIEIRYLDTWILFQTPDGNHGDMETIAVATGINSSFPRMNVAMRKTNSDSSIDSLESWSLDRIKQKDIKFISDVTPYISSFFSGATRDYSYDTHNAIMPNITRCKDYYFLINSKEYIFSFCAKEDEWENYAPVFDTIMGSLRLRIIK